MAILLKKITHVIDDLDTIQEGHINSFDQELLPDLEKQCKERNLLVERLAETIGSFTQKVKQLKADEDTEETIMFIKTRISDLLKQNRALEKKVRHHKNGIKKSMKKITAGRKMISSYGSPALSSNIPKVISYTE